MMTPGYNQRPLCSATGLDGVRGRSLITGRWGGDDGGGGGGGGWGYYKMGKMRV